MKLARLSILLACWTLTAGCAQLDDIIDPLVVQVADSVDESVAEVRNDLCSEAAWLRWRKLFRNQPYQFDFAAGFRSGYQNVINGGSGIPPMVPPKFYWRRCFENAWGRQKAQAWFEGYYYGGIAAQQDGAGIWYEIPLNRPPDEASLPAPTMLPPHDGEVDEVGPPEVPGPLIIDHGHSEQKLQPDLTPPAEVAPEEKPPLSQEETPAMEPEPTTPNVPPSGVDEIPTPPLEPAPNP